VVISIKQNLHITVEEAQHFFQFFYSHEIKFKLLFLIQATTGLRIGEVASIKINDFIRGTNFSKVLVKLEKKRKYEEIIEREIPEITANMIREYLLKYPYILSVERNPENWLFPCMSDGKIGGRITNTRIQLIFSQVRKRANLTECIINREKNIRTFLNGRSVIIPYMKRYRFNTHSFRRLFITQHYTKLNRTAFEIALIIGHSNSKTTEKYINEKEIIQNARVFVNDLYGKSFFNTINTKIPEKVNTKIPISFFNKSVKTQEILSI